MPATRLSRALDALPAPVKWVAAPLVLVGCVLLLVGSWTDPQKVAVPTPGPAAKQVCESLAGRLPDRVQGHGRKALTPVSPLTAAWDSSPRTVLRCGVGVPELLVKHPESDSVGVNGVDWLIEKHSNGDVLFTTVERTANVEVLVPKGAYPNATDPLPALSDAVAKAVPSRFTQ